MGPRRSADGTTQVKSSGELLFLVLVTCALRTPLFMRTASHSQSSRGEDEFCARAQSFISASQPSSCSQANAKLVALSCVVRSLRAWQTLEEAARVMSTLSDCSPRIVRAGARANERHEKRSVCGDDFSKRYQRRRRLLESRAYERTRI